MDSNKNFAKSIFSMFQPSHAHANGAWLGQRQWQEQPAQLAERH